MILSWKKQLNLKIVKIIHQVLVYIFESQVTKMIEKEKGNYPTLESYVKAKFKIGGSDFLGTLRFVNENEKTESLMPYKRWLISGISKLFIEKRDLKRIQGYLEYYGSQIGVDEDQFNNYIPFSKDQSINIFNQVRIGCTESVFLTKMNKTANSDVLIVSRICENFKLQSCGNTDITENKFLQFLISIKDSPYSEFEFVESIIFEEYKR